MKDYWNDPPEPPEPHTIRSERRNTSDDETNTMTYEPKNPTPHHDLIPLIEKGDDGYTLELAIGELCSLRKRNKELTFAAEWALDWIAKHDPDLLGIMSALSDALKIQPVSAETTRCTEPQRE